MKRQDAMSAATHFHDDDGKRSTGATPGDNSRDSTVSPQVAFAETHTPHDYAHIRCHVAELAVDSF